MGFYVEQLLKSVEKGQSGHCFEVSGEEIENVKEALLEYKNIKIVPRGKNYFLKVGGENA